MIIIFTEICGTRPKLPLNSLRSRSEGLNYFLVPNIIGGEPSDINSWPWAVILISIYKLTYFLG